MKNWSDLKFTIFIFILWEFFLYIVSIISLKLPLAGRNFFGGGLENYTNNPLVMGWANFDGEHYLSISQIGYKGLEQAFFPVYPMLIHFLSFPFGNNLLASTILGLIISNTAIFLSLIFLQKLISMDYSKDIVRMSAIALLIFPTSFYFHAVYSESLFLLLAILGFWLIRKNSLQLASAVGAISSATRIFGILLLPSFVIELWQQKKLFSLNSLWLLLTPLGFLIYIYYQWVTAGDPLAFYHLQKIVGPQHESGVTLLPQVYFRYINMLLTVSYENPIFQAIILEFFVGAVFFILPIYGYFRKVRVSYLFYALIGFLLPTIQGSFSSIPRYILVFFPSFLILSIFIRSLPLFLRIVIMVLSISWLAFETILFLRGYWVA